MWMGLDGADGYAPTWLTPILLAERFEGTTPMEWDTPAGWLWAGRIATVYGARRIAEQFQKPPTEDD